VLIPSVTVNKLEVTVCNVGHLVQRRLDGEDLCFELVDCAPSEADCYWIGVALTSLLLDHIIVLLKHVFLHLYLI